MNHFQYIVIGNGLVGSAAGRYLSEWSKSVAVIGPEEPANHQTHDGVYSSHYDQGRLVRLASPDPIWHPISNQAVTKYPSIEAESGVPFHKPTGRIYAKKVSDAEREEIQAWMTKARSKYGIVYEYVDAHSAAWQAKYPELAFPDEYEILIEPNPAGVINPREMKLAQNVITQKQGGSVISDQVTAVHSSADSVEVITKSGQSHTAEKVLVACGSFTNFNNLLPAPIPLRYKTETMLWADVSAETAERLKHLPGMGYDIEDEHIDDIYLAPPLLYPDGTYKIKMGCNTMGESWPTTLEEIQFWFQSGNSDADKEPMERALRSMFPGVDFLKMTTHRCIVTYTPSGYPTIDQVPSDPYGRLYVATGGNGTGAQGSDTLGNLAAGLMHDGRWIDEVAREPFLATHSWDQSHKKRTKAQERASQLANC
ncbi:MAG: FAD-binding oxidoreductase [Chloroflexota bacterium]